MLRYLLWRSIYTIAVIFAASIVIFFTLRISPGTPEFIIHQPMAAEEERERFREEQGLNDPIIVQYGNFLADVFRGDLGTSIDSNIPVVDLIAEFGKNSAILVAAGVVVTFSIAIPLGVIAAVKRNSWIDQTIMGCAALGMGIPNFILALFLILIVGIELDWLPISGKGGLRHLILPAIVLAAEGVAVMLRLMRASMLDQLQQDYIRTLRAKGLSHWRTIWQHALRNALLPIISLSALQVAALIGYTFVVETIFRWPGISRLLIESILQRDYPVALIVTLLFTIAVILANFLANIAYSLVDPRIRQETTLRV